MSRLLSNYEKLKLLDIYGSGLSLRKCAKLLGRSITGCRKILIENNILIRTRGESNRIHHVDESFFDNIDTEHKAYWLGFIFADGCVRVGITNDCHLSILLASLDKKHLYKFRESIQSQHNVIDDKIRPVSSIVVHSCRLVNALTIYGVVPRKARIANPNMDFIPSWLHKHFWRGVIDGDGSILRGSDGLWQVSLIGTKQTVLKFRSFVNNLVGEVSGWDGKDGNCYRTYFKQIRICKKVVEELYSESTVYLDRKKENADALLAEVITPCFSKDISKSDLILSFERLGSWSVVSKFYNVSISQLRLVRRKFGLTIREGNYKGIPGKSFFTHSREGKFLWKPSNKPLIED